MNKNAVIGFFAWKEFTMKHPNSSIFINLLMTTTTTTKNLYFFAQGERNCIIMKFDYKNNGYFELGKLNGKMGKILPRIL